VDCRCDRDGHAQFLEVNPLAGLHPELGDLVILAGLAGVAYDRLIESIVRSACERVQTGVTTQRATVD
jgi:D-alanine-D-alanine ligase